MGCREWRPVRHLGAKSKQEMMKTLTEAGVMGLEVMSEIDT